MEEGINNHLQINSLLEDNPFKLQTKKNKKLFPKNLKSNYDYLIKYIILFYFKKLISILVY